MEKYDLLKKLKNLPNPDAHSSMDINVIVSIVDNIIRAATDIITSGAG